MLTNTSHTTYHFPPGLNLSAHQQALRWFTQPLELLSECYKTLGDAFTLEIDHSRHVFFCDAESVSAILKADATQFYSSADRAFMEPLTGKFSLFNLDSAAHLNRRRLLSPPFHAGKIKTLGQTVADITLQTLAAWPENKSIVLLDEMLSISMQIIFNVIFGLQDDVRSEKVKSQLESLMRMTRSGAVFSQNGDNTAALKLKNTFRLLKSELDSLLLEIIREKQLKPDDASLLALMCVVRDENNEELSAEEIKDHAIAFLFAGHETTGTAVTWAMYWIHKNPVIKQRLLCEMENFSVVDELQGNEYFNAICQETLRIVPLVGIISRHLKKPIQLSTYVLPAGVNLTLPIFLLHQNQDVFPNPKEFDPQRFIGKKYAFNEYMPFGGGSRICLGMAFANYQMKIILATLLKNVEMELQSAHDAKPVRKGIVYAPAEGVLIKVKKKNG